MTSFPRPAEGTWTEHHPELGTGFVPFEDSISPEFHELEREAIFRRAWLNVGRIDDLPRPGTWFTKDLVAAGTSLLVVRDMDDQVRAFCQTAHPGFEPGDDVRATHERGAVKLGGSRGRFGCVRARSARELL